MSKQESPAHPTPYAWLVFALILALMLSDYMSRQVLASLFPQIKAAWQLSDAQLGQLGGVVPLMVALLTLPLSLAADRFGRVRAITVMALFWSLATLACGLAQNFGQMLGARLAIGAGEAAYGSAGLAVLIGIFPVHMRARLTGIFMAGGTFGAVLGVALGGKIAALHGWRTAFFVMAALGLIIAIAFAAIVREKRLAAPITHEKPRLTSLFNSPTLLLTYAGSGLQLLVAGMLIAWLPSFFNRTYHLPLDKAGHLAALVLLAQGVGMALCGVVADKATKADWRRGYLVAIGFALAGSIILITGFAMSPSTLQIALIILGASVVAGHSGPVGAIVTRLTPTALHGTAIAVLTVANNVLGLMPGNWAAGVLADRVGLQSALQIMSAAPLIAVPLYALAWWRAGKR